MAMPYADRREGGRVLGELLARRITRDLSIVVLGLPRGGVPVAFEVATALRAPLDVLVVRKLGVPGQPELAMGAIASGGAHVMIDEVARFVRPGDIARIVEREREELRRREAEYRDGRSPAPIAGRHVVLVDDGLATGASMRAAIAAVRQQRPARITVAAPVGARETCEELSALVDEVVCAAVPQPFIAVGYWYQRFAATPDQEVRGLLAEAAARGMAGHDGHPGRTAENDASE